MAEMTIHLRTDPATGKKDILVDYHSDEDALPHEHEQRHRALVQKLIEGGLVRAEEIGQVIVEREQVAGMPSSEAEHAPGRRTTLGGGRERLIAGRTCSAHDLLCPRIAYASGSPT